MQSYASLHSPSIRKMNGQDPSQRDGPYGSPPGRFDFGNIIGDPFALASISIAAVSILPSCFFCWEEVRMGKVRRGQWANETESTVSMASYVNRKCDSFKSETEPTELHVMGDCVCVLLYSGRDSSSVI